MRLHYIGLLAGVFVVAVWASWKSAPKWTILPTTSSCIIAAAAWQSLVVR